MPPRGARKTAAGPRSKRALRGRAVATADVQIDPDESNVKAEEEEPVVPIEEEKPLAPLKEEREQESDLVEEIQVEENREASIKKDDNSKDPVDHEISERLDLDDNDPEYEIEEYAGGDYDEKDLEQDPQEEGEEVVQDPQEEGDDVEEEVEEVDIGEEDDGDLNEDVEDIPEELEPEEDDELVRQVHAEMVVSAEEREHHEVFKERRKRKEFEVFVGGLDKDATEKDLRKVFSEVGEVVEVRLMLNPQTKKNKGFAFLRFATVEQAKRACAQLKNPVVRGKQCGVAPSQDNDTLFLGNICRKWTKEALKEKLRHYGVENIEGLALVEDSNNVGMNRGFAFLEFYSRADAMDAFKHLQRRDVVFGVDRPAKVSFADSFFDPGDEIMAQVKTVFVDGLCTSWDEDYVKELLKIYGKIENVELARNMPSARRKDYGFVTFETHDAAVTCARSINNEELGEGDKKAKVRARLSRPLQKGKGRHAAHGEFWHGRGSTLGIRSTWSRPIPRSIPPRGPRRIGPRFPAVVERGFKRPVNIRDRRLVVNDPPRSRPVVRLPRSYDRRPPVPYSDTGLKRDYRRPEEPNPRSRVANLDYGSRVPSDRHTLYRDDSFPRGTGYPDLPRDGSSRVTARRAYVDDSSRVTARRAYVDDGYGQRYEKPPPTYREQRVHEYDSMSGSKRPYTALDDVPPRYAETGVRHSRVRMDYDFGTNAAHYGDAYSERLERPNPVYGGNRTSLSNPDSHRLYSGHPGSHGGGDGGIYSSSFGGDYMARGSDVGGSSYSSLYSGRDLGGNSYMGSGGSRTYY